MTEQATEVTGSRSPMTRRQALARLGLGTAIAYAAPTVVHLDRSANARVRPTPCRGDHSKGKGKGKGGGGCPPD